MYNKPVVDKIEFDKEESMTLVHAGPKQECLYGGS